MKSLDSRILFDGISCIDPAFIEEAGTPVKKEFRKAAWWRTVRAIAASFVLIAGVFLGINAVSPAFAEELPLVGEIFRRLNSLGAHAGTYDGVVQTLGEQAENDQYKVMVTEAYCDGEYVFFALRLLPKEPRLLKMETMYTKEAADAQGTPGWRVILNGEEEGYTLPVFTRKGSYFESNPIKADLPDGIDPGTTIQVEAFLGNLFGRTEEAAGKGDDGQLISLEPVRLYFDVTANTDYNRQETVQDVEVDGLELQSWSCSPSKLSVTLAYPYFDPAGVSVHACTGDGLDLGEDLGISGDFGDGRYSYGDTAVQECTVVGPPDGTEKVIVTVYKERPEERDAGAAVFGEFTINLGSGEAASTTSYLDQGFEHLPIDQYADAEIAKKKAQPRTPTPSQSPAPKMP